MKHKAIRLIPMPPQIREFRRVMMDMKSKYKYNAYTESMASYFRAEKHLHGWNHKHNLKLLNEITDETKKLDGIHNKPIEDVEDGISIVQRRAETYLGKDPFSEFISQKQHDNEGKSFIVL